MSAQHRLSEVDATARTARCAACGPVDIVRRTGRASRARVAWRCKNKARADRARFRRAEHMRGDQHILKLGHEERVRLLDASGWACLICDTPLTLETMRADHEHGTRNLRGALCSSCNTGIGLLGDDLDGLRRAVAYLESYADNGCIIDNGPDMSGEPVPMPVGATRVTARRA